MFETAIVGVARQTVIDPIARRRYQPARDSDYAVISFARHPFGAEDRLALVIAGTNGPATAGAIHRLATKGLEGRPLGAVVRVRPAGTTCAGFRTSSSMRSATRSALTATASVSTSWLRGSVGGGKALARTCTTSRRGTRSASTTGVGATTAGTGSTEREPLCTSCASAPSAPTSWHHLGCDDVWLDNALQDFVERDLMVCRDDKYLALALPENRHH